MRRQLFAAYLAVVAVAILSLSVPLALSFAGNALASLTADRTGDTARLAREAAQALTSDAGSADVDVAVDRGASPRLSAVLARFAEQSGASAVVVSAQGLAVAWTDTALATPDPRLAALLDRALAGEPARDAGAAWPWRTRPLTVAEPVVVGTRVAGAVATLSPVDGAGAGVALQWSLLALADLAVMALAVAALRPVMRRILQPVQRLDRAAREWRFGDSTELVDIGPAPPELRQLSESFNDFAARIATLLARQRTFASYASHQLRTPLSILMLGIETFRPDPNDEDAVADYQALVAEIERMARICDSLLAYASAESVAADATDVDVSELADQRVERWGPAAQQAGVTLARRGMAGVVARVAHEAVGQCLDVFIDNAVKYAGAGARVVVATYALPGGKVQVDVIDDGPGVAGPDPSRAAEAFWRDQATAHLAGTGLGVTIADALVVASGGRLSLLPVRPHGLRVRLLLPAGQSGTDHDGSTAPAAAADRA